MKTINTTQLADLLSEDGHKGADIVSFLALTDANARKTGRPDDLKEATILKLIAVNCVIRYRYGRLAHKHLGEGYAIKPRAWGTRLPNGLITHTNAQGQTKLYVSAMVRRAINSPLYYARINGVLKSIPKEVVAPLLPKPSPVSPFAVRDYALDSILMLKQHKERLRVAHESSQSVL